MKYVPYRLKSNATAEQVAEHKRNRAFYDMSGDDNVYKYITTERKLVGEETKKFTMYDYLQKSTGVFNQNGMISAEEVRAMKKRAQTGEKNIWYGFISFDEEHSPLIDHPDKCIALIKQTFGEFFKDAGFDKDNMDLMCVDGFFGSLSQLFTPEITSHRNRLREIEEEMQAEHEQELQEAAAQEQSRRRWDWSK